MCFTMCLILGARILMVDNIFTVLDLKLLETDKQVNDKR